VVHIEADLHPPLSGLADTDPDGTSRAVAERHGDPGDVQELRRSASAPTMCVCSPRCTASGSTRCLTTAISWTSYALTIATAQPLNACRVDQPFLLEESQGLTKRGATDPELR